MRCPKKLECIPCLQRFASKDYMCCGLNKKPKKYKNDVIKLCLKNKIIADFTLEMTPSEALDMASCITSTLANIAKS